MRLDCTDPERVTSKIREITAEAEWDLTDDEMKGPIDLCVDCVNELGLEVHAEAEHPPYSDGGYNCLSCEMPLTEEDELQSVLSALQASQEDSILES